MLFEFLSSPYSGSHQFHSTIIFLHPFATFILPSYTCFAIQPSSISLYYLTSYYCYYFTCTLHLLFLQIAHDGKHTFLFLSSPQTTLWGRLSWEGMTELNWLSNYLNFYFIVVNPHLFIRMHAQAHKHTFILDPTSNFTCTHTLFTPQWPQYLIYLYVLKILYEFFHLS